MHRSQPGGHLRHNFQRQLHFDSPRASDEMLKSLSLHELHRVEVIVAGPSIFGDGLGLVCDADETQIEASLGEAIRIAKEEKSVSLEKRAEANAPKRSMGRSGFEPLKA